MNILTEILKYIYALLQLLQMLDELKFEHSQYMYVLVLAPLGVFLMVLITTRRAWKIKRTLEVGATKALIIIPVYAINLLSKTLLLLLLMLLLLKPYILVERVIPIEEEMEGKYMDKSIACIVLIDCSHSMALNLRNSSRLEFGKLMAISLLDRLRENDTVIAAFFADSIVASTPPNASVTAIKEMIRKFNATHDYTSIGNALSYALSLRELLQKPMAIILISDGGNNGGANPLEIAEKARQMNVPIFTIFVGDGRYSNRYVLQAIASKSNGTFFDSSNVTTEALGKFSKVIARKMKYLTLKRTLRLEERVLVKDYNTPFRVITRAMLVLALLMFLTGV